MGGRGSSGGKGSGGSSGGSRGSTANKFLMKEFEGKRVIEEDGTYTYTEGKAVNPNDYTKALNFRSTSNENIELNNGVKVSPGKEVVREQGTQSNSMAQVNTLTLGKGSDGKTYLVDTVKVAYPNGYSDSWVVNVYRKKSK